MAEHVTIVLQVHVLSWFHCYECRFFKILFLLQDSVAFISLHSYHMCLTDPHCSMIGDGGMALKQSGYWDGPF